MLSKDGFKHHLDNISHNTVMAEFYKDKHPDVAKQCLQSVESSKEILLNYYDKVNRP